MFENKRKRINEGIKEVKNGRKSRSNEKKLRSLSSELSTLNYCEEVVDLTIEELKKRGNKKGANYYTAKFDYALTNKDFEEVFGK